MHAFTRVTSAPMLDRMERNTLGCVLLALGMVLSSCSKGDGSDDKRDGDAGSSGRATGSGGGGARGAIDFSNAGAAPTQTPMIVDAGQPDTGVKPDVDAALGADNACGVGTATAELTPVNMFVMFDRSGSMNDDNKWGNATAALNAFFQNPGADKLSVALRFFPHDEPAAGCTEDACDAVACSQPLVPIGTLSAEPAPADAQEQALVTAIADSAPGGGRRGGGTPIYAALDGSLRWASDYQSMHEDQKTVVIFVTDGEPNGCDEDFDNISMLAATALADSGVTTYAIGLEGSSTAQMDQLAAAGGTSQGIYIGDSANAEEELLSALNMIRADTLSCDFPMPEAMGDDMEIDPAKVNVTFTPAGGMAATLGQVPDDDGCGTKRSWHYDKPDDPTRIVLCPAACDLVRSAPEAKLEILIGCATVCGGLDVDCGGEPPPEVPPVIID
jgi:hypothetical protein